MGAGAPRGREPRSYSQKTHAASRTSVFQEPAEVTVPLSSLLVLVCHLAVPHTHSHGQEEKTRREANAWSGRRCWRYFWVGRPRTPAPQRVSGDGNRLLRQQIPGRVRLTDAQCTALAEIGKKLGRRGPGSRHIVKPDTVWRGTASSSRRSLMVPSNARLPYDLIARSWRHWRSAWRRKIAPGGTIAWPGALRHLGYTISAQTVGNILKRTESSPPPRKKTTTWNEFIRTHMEMLSRQTSSPRKCGQTGLVTYNVLYLFGSPAEKYMWRLTRIPMRDG